MGEATANHNLMSNALLEDEIEADTEQGENARRHAGLRIQSGKLTEFYTLGTILGDCYSDSPVIDRAGLAEPPRDFLNYVPRAEPGCRAPHAWLHDGSSLFDHFGLGLTLLATSPPAQAGAPAAQADAHRMGIPPAGVRPDETGVQTL